MSGISRKVAKHTLNIKPGSRLVKQGMRCFNQEKLLAMAKSYPGSRPLASLRRFSTQTR
jgi:hypothetical protein